ncbi:hypothetical protein [Elizabethkingia ursingii]
MLKMTEVTDRITRKEFLEFPVRLYRLDKNFIRTMDKDVEDIFNPVKNKFLAPEKLPDGYALMKTKKQSVA